MKRVVNSELLDTLSPGDSRAARSRRDLQRVNAWMGHCGLIARALRSACPVRTARRLVDLGTGDGRFLLRVARRLSAAWHGTRAVLLDRRPVVSPETCQALEALGWSAEAVEADAIAWLGLPATPACDVMLANLFLHHLSEEQLAALLRGAAGRTRVFIAAEPSRSSRNLLFSRLLWLIGCSHVTRHDALVSVRAGFVHSELSRLWPPGQGWTLEEHPAGWFSHLFVAHRRE